jgi:methyl-accepting chemotaxis protein
MRYFSKLYEYFVLSLCTGRANFSMSFLRNLAQRLARIGKLSLRLNHKILSIGIVGVVGVVLVGGMHLYAGAEIARYNDEAEKAQVIFELSDKIEIELLNSRRAERDFLNRSDRKKADIQKQISVAAAADISDLQARLQGIGRNDLAGKVEAMSKSLKKYQTSLDAAVEDKIRLGLDENSGFEVGLRKSVKDFEAKVNQLNQPKLLVTMLMMRQLEKDFMLRRDDKYGDEMKTLAEEFSIRLNETDVSEAEKAELKKKLADYQRDFSAWFDGALFLADDMKAAAGAFTALEPVIEAVSKATAEIRAEADQANMAASAKWSWSTNAVIVLIAISALGISIFIGRSVSKPLSSVTAAMIELSGGNFAVDLPGLGRSDEIGDIAKAVEVFKKNGLEVERMRSEQQALEQRSAELRKADMVKLADSFEAAVGEIVEAVSSASTEFEASAGTLTSTAERAQKLTTSVAEASEEASGNVQSVAAATEELSSSVNEIGRQVQESARIAGEAVDQVRQTNDRVSELSKAAGLIGDVVELINTIAGQTNLLALNATIEAARAGEAGRGFAVVASEVKALAEQTAKATGQISQQITGIQSATQDSVASIQQIGSTIERLSEISSAIAAAVEEQGTTTQEISRNAQQAAGGTQQVSSNIVDVQRGANETGSASSQLLAAAQSLSGESHRLKLEVGKFLASVRAA